jgi:hypothetical protein
MRRSLAVVFGVILVSMFFVGCGGGDDDEASGDDDDVAAASADEESGGDDGDDGSDDSDSGSASAAVAAFTQADCLRAVQALGAATASVSLAMSGGDSEALEDSIEQMEEFADNAPGDIKDEIETLSKAYEEYAAAIRESGWNPGEQPNDEQIEALEEASKKLEAEDVQDAQAKLDEWFSEECSG